MIKIINKHYPDSKMFVTPLVCTICNCDMGGVYALEKLTNKYLCETMLNFLCPKCNNIVFNKLGYEK